MKISMVLIMRSQQEEEVVVPVPTQQHNEAKSKRLHLVRQ